MAAVSPKLTCSPAKDEQVPGGVFVSEWPECWWLSPKVRYADNVLTAMRVSLASDYEQDVPIYVALEALKQIIPFVREEAHAKTLQSAIKSAISIACEYMGQWWESKDRVFTRAKVDLATDLGVLYWKTLWPTAYFVQHHTPSLQQRSTLMDYKFDDAHLRVTFRTRGAPATDFTLERRAWPNFEYVWALAGQGCCVYEDVSKLVVRHEYAVGPGVYMHSVDVDQMALDHQIVMENMRSSQIHGATAEACEGSGLGLNCFPESPRNQTGPAPTPCNTPPLVNN